MKPESVFTVQVLLSVVCQASVVSAGALWFLVCCVVAAPFWQPRPHPSGLGGKIRKAVSEQLLVRDVAPE